MTYRSNFLLNVGLILLFNFVGITEQRCAGQSPEEKKSVISTDEQLIIEAPHLDYQRITLEPVKQRDVYDQYINLSKSPEANGYKLEIFDGANERAIHFKADEFIGISKNQKYFTVSRLHKGLGFKNAYYEVEVHDLSNRVIGKGSVSILGSDEREDEIYPLEDGSGFVQKAFLFSGGLLFSVYRKEQNASSLSRSIHIDKAAYTNGSLSIDLDQKLFAISFMDNPVEAAPNSYVQCYALDGTLIWETTLSNHLLKSELYISSIDGTVAFVTKKLDDIDNKHLFIYNNRGIQTKRMPVYKGGLYKSRFQVVDSTQYLLSPSDGSFFYVIDLARNNVVNKHTEYKANACVTGVLLYDNQIVSSYFCGNFVRGDDNRSEFVLLEKGICVEDNNGEIICEKIDIQGMPFIHLGNKGLFLIDVQGYGMQSKSNFLRINIK